MLKANWLIALSVILLLSVSSHALADTKSFSEKGISVSPSIQNINLTTDTTERPFTLYYTNTTKNILQLTISAQDFGSLDQTGGVLLEGSNSYTQKFGLVRWLSLGTTKLTLPPQTTESVNAMILNQPSLQPGGHYGAIVATIDNPGSIDGNQVALSQQIISLLLLDKIGGDHYDMKLNNVIQNGTWIHLPTNVSLLFQNKGNVHLVPRGLVQLKAPNGTTISRGIINSDSAYILPQTSRLVNVPLTTVARGFSLPGIYRLEVDYRYDGLSKYGKQIFAVRYIDLKLYLLIVTMLIIVFAIYWKFRRSIRQSRKPS